MVLLVFISTNHSTGDGGRYPIIFFKTLSWTPMARSRVRSMVGRVHFRLVLFRPFKVLFQFTLACGRFPIGFFSGIVSCPLNLCLPFGDDICPLCSVR